MHSIHEQTQTSLQPMATVSEALAIATKLHRDGRLQEAEQVYLKILAAVPNQLDAVYFLGVIAQQIGKYQVSVEYLQRTVEFSPDHAEAYNNLGIGLAALGKLDEAIASYRRALELRPDYAKALDNMGNALQDLGKLDEAIASYRRSLDIKPDSAPTYNNLGTAWAECGNQDEAAACYRRALKWNPVFGESHHNLGNALRSQGKLEEAIACYRCALEHDPNKPKGYNVLGLCLAEQRKLDEAIECYRRALELMPDCLSSLGSLIHGMQLACFWDSLDELSHRLLDLLDEDFGPGPNPRKQRHLSHRLNEQLGRDFEKNDFSLQPFFLLSLPIVSSAKMQLQCAQRWAEKELKTPPVVLATPNRNGAAKRKSRTTIGYLSADYHNHPVGIQIGEMFEKHNRDRFEVIGYSLGRDDGSTTRRRLMSAFDRFVDVRHMSIEQASNQIVTDGVDILVDLMGYTQDARTEILALRPAPIQVSYLGYPSSTGASFIDYILVDDYVVPLDQQPFFTEKLVTMPGCFLVNDSQRQIAQSTPSRSGCNLPETGFVFCCFNNNYKITSQMFSIWMELLKAVPGSVLWLSDGNQFARDNLRREAAARSVAVERLVFAKRMPLHPEHLARHRLADLFLDTFPYNAHVTASDALWAGCPVLTMSGETYASRVAGSLLRALDLPELITTTIADYYAMGLRLARESNLLADLKSRLDVNRKSAPVFDGGQFAHNLEQAYTTMHAIYTAGEKPRAFSVSDCTGS